MNEHDFVQKSDFKEFKEDMKKLLEDHAESDEKHFDKLGSRVGNLETLGTQIKTIIVVGGTLVTLIELGIQLYLHK